MHLQWAHNGRARLQSTATDWLIGFSVGLAPAVEAVETWMLTFIQSSSYVFVPVLEFMIRVVVRKATSSLVLVFFSSSILQGRDDFMSYESIGF